MATGRKDWRKYYRRRQPRVGGGRVYKISDLVSARERNQREVDEVLTVARDVEKKYSSVLQGTFQVANMGKGSSTMGYFDYGGNLAIGQNYFDSDRMTTAYDECVKQGYHPSRGNKTGIEAVVAHEMGHKLSNDAAIKMGLGHWRLHDASDIIVEEALKKVWRYKNNSKPKTVFDMQKAISGYAQENNAECVAEAFADVYCNKKKAKAESRAIVSVLEKYLK